MPTIDRNARADALLGQTRHARSGQLKVFLGAAPGVGKTCAMLNAARERQRHGVDVVVGVVETHGRADTAALLDGLEVLPRRQVDYRGHTLAELDIDALLQRAPALALIDELAHSNAPGSRHAKRWQDVIELLDAGIDVYTTVNIQHVESLNDVVLQITGIRVRETVPDAVFDRARDQVLVDLPPRELIERLQQGKVYVPETAQSALDAYFTPANLTALRELAVQKIADEVDADLREHQTAAGAAGTPVRRRVLVAVDARGQAEFLVRAGRRIAERRQAPWTVVTVDRGTPLSDAAQRDLDRALRLAERLGADTAVLRGHDVAELLLDYAGQRQVSTIVIGHTRERLLARMVGRTVSQQLITRGAHLELTILSPPAARARSRGERELPRVESGWRDYARATGVAALAVALAHALADLLPLANLSLVFISAVLLVATRTSRGPAVYTALLSFLAYNYFFTEPRYTLAINQRDDLYTVLLFLVAALVCSDLAVRLRRQVLLLAAANRESLILQRLTERLGAATDARGVCRVAAEELAESFDCAVLIAEPRAGSLQISAAVPAQSAIDAATQAVLDWSAQHVQEAGRYTDTLSGARVWCAPAAVDKRVLAVVAVAWPLGWTHLPPAVQRLSERMLQQLATALERTHLTAGLEEARVQGETERLRAALLSSVSHDLRSPLASMIGAAGSLLAYGERIGEGDRRELLESIHHEGERLDRYIQNLLDMTRLGHGGLTLKRDWVALEEIVGSATQRLARSYPDLPVHSELPADLPLLYVHPALIEQALFNVLENAARFTPPGSAVQIEVRTRAERLQIDVSDRGPGIPEEERARVFDMFYSVSRGDRGGGTGLGLAICQGMIGAHGGQVLALAGPDGIGTTVRLELPVAISTEVKV
ncbi:MAG: sensor histidine kinase KdpD [Lysobacterales bacterium]